MGKTKNDIALAKLLRGLREVVLKRGEAYLPES